MSEDIIVTEQLAEDLGLTKEEFKKIEELLGRRPNYTELGMFSAMWSEHCSYKNSKPVLRLFPTEGKQVLQGPGENAGVVDIGDGEVVVFKIESHNHPSAIEPYHASATGGGGCLRDIFTMGARPICLLDSLRFGSIKDKNVAFLLKEVIRGFSDYANKVGVPVLGGEIYFDQSYSGNPLVNAMAVGIGKKDDIVRARAGGVGNLVIIFGGATGRDGVEGAALASKGMDEEAQKKSSAVAIGDPHMGRLLREATLELIKKRLVVGMQDMGAAGLTCSTCEISYKSSRGMEIDISQVPRKEEGMSPYEIMLSESQERMLAIVEEKNLAQIKEVLSQWSVPFSIIGRITDDGIVRVKDKERVIAQIPAKFLVEAPIYHREEKKPDYLDQLSQLDLESLKESQDYNRILLSLLSLPTIASKEWVYQRGDSKLNEDICLLPGCDAGVYCPKAGKKAVAVCVDGNGGYCYLDPFRGGMIAVAEAARNLVCVGAKPIAITDGLNFGNPSNPEVFWQFKQVVLGMSEASKVLGVPVVSGNVSFNNENPRGAIDPTPIVGMVGIIEDRKRITTADFKAVGDIIILLGENKEELGGSLYLKLIYSLKQGNVPQLDLSNEKSLQDAVLEMIKEGLVESAHDCSEGGLAVSLAECCILNKERMLGCEVDNLAFKIRPDALLFGETQSRIIISVKESNLPQIKAIVDRDKVPLLVIGRVTNENFKIKGYINLPLIELSSAFRTAFKKL